MNNRVCLLALWISVFAIFSAPMFTQSPQEKLHMAIVNDSVVDIREALKVGANVNLGIGNLPPIMVAVLLDQAKAVECLLDCGADPKVSYHDKTPLLHVLKRGVLSTAILLVHEGADYSGFVDQGIDVLTYVARYFDRPIAGKSEQIDLDFMHELSQQGYDLKKNLNNPDLSNNAWYWVLKYNKVNHIYFFLNLHPSYKISCAANPNHVFAVPDGSFTTPLLMCTANNAWGAIESLLKAGADINQVAKPDSSGKSQSPLSYALTRQVNDDWFLIEFLIEHGASMEEAFDLFIKNGGSPNHQIKYQYRPPVSLLLRAIYGNNKQAVKILLDAGADINFDAAPWPNDPNVLLRCRHTPLKAALIKGDGELIELLMSYGGQI